MKLKLLIAFVLSLQTLLGASQLIGDEWIVSGQRYFKIPVAHTGLYKLDYDWLQNHGVPVNEIDPSTIQIWRRGEEHAVKIVGQSDATFDSGDCIYFFGERRDGATESELYLQPEYQAHQHYSLFADTSAYFLTWNSSGTGKRFDVVPNDLTTPVLRSMGHELLLDTTSYAFGWEREEYIFLSEYDRGEGFFGNVITNGRSYSKTLDALNFDENSPEQITININLVGRNNLTHVVEVVLGESAPEVFQVPAFSGSEFVTFSTLVDPSLIENDKLKVEVRPLGENGDADAISVGFIELSYPKTLIANNGHRWQAAFSDVGLVKVSASTNLNIALDITNPKQVREFELSRLSQDSVSFSQGGNHVWLGDTLNAFVPAYVHEVNFKDYTGFDAGYLILTHESLLSGVQDYVDYRASFEGGGYSSHVVLESELNDQFAYGERNPLAVKRLFRKLIAQNTKPKYFFIIGNGSVTSLKNGGKPYMRFLDANAQNANGVQQYGNVNLVYTYGNPGSDILFSAGIENNTGEPAVPTGRIGVRSLDQLDIYLEKVKAYEAQGENQAWKKRVLHLSGGATAGEANYFLSSANTWGQMATQPVFGGVVQTYTKKTLDEVEFINVTGPVNEGVGLMTFLGHSAPNLTEIDISKVSNPNSGINNEGKYPVMLFNGCHSGDVFNNTTIIEDWLFTTPKKGSIVGMAHSSYGYTNTLIDYSNRFYQKKFNDTASYKLSLGELQKEIIHDFNAVPNSNWRKYTQATQFMYFGDPAIQYFAAEKPDYTFRDNAVKISSTNANEPLTALSQDYYLEIPLMNLGKYLLDTVAVCVEHTFANGEVSEVYGPYDVSSLAFEDTLKLRLEAGDIRLSGENQYRITIDCENTVEELDESNNEILYSYNFISDAIQNVLPANFSISGSETTPFVFHPFMVTDQEEIVLQVDTSKLFNSPLLHEQTFTGGLVELTYQLPVTADSTVYYWRTSVQGEELWTNSSFTFIKDQSGWMQSTLGQYDENALSSLEIDDNYTQIYYSSSSTSIAYAAAGNAVPDYKLETYLRVNEQAVILNASVNRCQSDALFSLAFDKKTGLPYRVPGSFGRLCGTEPRMAYSFNALHNSSQASQLTAYIDSIPEGDYVFLFTSGNAKIEEALTHAPLKDQLDGLGVTAIYNVNNGEPYVLLAQKGNVTPLLELKGSDAAQVLEDDIQLDVLESYGEMRSGFIGPKNDWGEFSFDWEAIDKDSLNVSLEMYDQTGQYLSALDHVSANLDLDSLNIVYGFDKVALKASFTDKVDQHVSNLKYWFISAEEVPELVLIPANDKYIYGLKEGEKLQLDFTLQNVSEVDVDEEVLVLIEWTGLENNMFFVDSIRVPAVLAQIEQRFEYEFTPIGLQGEFAVRVFANPYEQAEVSYTNNFAQYQINLLGDVVKPNIQVQFDGRVIPDGAIVSPSPEIRIQVVDNNDFVFISDTSAVKYTLFRLDELGIQSELNLNELSDGLTWVAETENTPFEVVFLPSFSEGSYRLAVHALDVSGNESESYQVDFGVQSSDRAVIHEVHPNPSSTMFQFELSAYTNDLLPDDVSLEIFNSTGELVYSATRDDYDSWRVGDRQVSFTWYPDAALSGGLYIYVISYLFGSEALSESDQFLLVD